ncbi:hypothetical protein Acr_00g0077690 [Actinidia rufa]|uniref:Integrase catalytic domain-containing protein n=1 Tax=Actinidia rufa TaxID=165716 RepID=A0A7J0DTB0_9ERIC|nr:hypothetical protein Acr_00g0077690 [Actinidia rufa]
MISGPHHPDLENRIRGDIRIVKQMHKVLSVHSPAKKLSVAAAEPESLIFTKADLDKKEGRGLHTALGHQIRHFLWRRSSLWRPSGGQTVLPCYGLHKVHLVEEEHEVLEDVERNPEAKAVEDLVRFELDEPSSDRFFLTGANLEERERTDLIQFLKANIKVFAWTPYEMPGIDLNFIRYGLNVLLDARPVKQRGRRFVTKHVDTVIEEVEKLKKTSAITETMDAYIDDMVVKSKEEPDHIRDLTKVFDILKRHKLRLNVAKCTFGVDLGNFLADLVMRRGIEANPKQITVINNLVSPKTAKEVQKLIGIAATLNRFINKSSDKCRPFFKPLCKNIKFSWNEECELALQEFKKYLTQPPLHSTPNEGELLYVYLTVLEHAVSLVLLREVNGEQRPIYFVSKIFTDCQTRAAIKGQVLEDFVAEFSPHAVSPKQGYLVSTRSREKSSTSRPPENQPEPRGPEVTQEPPQISATSSTSRPTKGPEVVSEPLQIDPTTTWKMLNFPTSNNKAKYEAFIAGLRSANKPRIPELYIFSDSKLVVNQVIGKFKAWGHKMAKYLAVAKSLLTDFKAVKIEQVGRDLNSHADALAGLVSVFEGEAGRTIAVEIISALSLERQQKFVLTNHELGPNWMDPIPFVQWEMDIVGVLARAPRNKKFLLATTEYFTKWVEAEPLTQIREMDVIRFIQRNILSSFGIPRAFILDNGTQFIGKKVRNLLEQLKIKFYNSTLSYLQCNGHARASDKTIMNGIKKRLEKAKGKWVEELPNVLWAYRTTSLKATNKMPYSLAFSFETMIPLESSDGQVYTSPPAATDLEVAVLASSLQFAQSEPERSTGHRQNARERVFSNPWRRRTARYRLLGTKGLPYKSFKTKRGSEAGPPYERKVWGA